MRKTELGTAHRGPVAMRPCAATGCQATVNVPLLMCVEHWRLVPAAVRRHVWGCWRRIGHDREARDDHAKAVQAAIEAVHGKQLAKKARRDAATPDLF